MSFPFDCHLAVNHLLQHCNANSSKNKPIRFQTLFKFLAKTLLVKVGAMISQASSHLSARLWRLFDLFLTAGGGQAGGSPLKVYRFVI